MLREKHTSGYISFLKLKLPEYKHVFAIRDKGFNDSMYYKLSIPNNSNVHIVDTYNDVFSDPLLAKICSKAKKIVFSGIWTAAPFMEELMKHPALLRKTWLQFWGGDYICFQTGVPKVEESDREILTNAFRHCAGLVFLTNGEYERFSEITGVENRHMIAPVPKDPRRKIPSISEVPHSHEIPRILVGNSANHSSHHTRILELLHSAYPNDIFDVICPLSYGGGPNYISEIISLGQKYFGEHFIPLLKYMEPDEYDSMLANCDVGIFDFERQQGLGNINTLLLAGKKVYLNQTSPLWKSLSERGCILFSINEIGTIPFRDFASMQESDRQTNRIANDPVKFDAQKRAQWKALLEA